MLLMAPRNNPQEPTAIRNPNNGDRVVSNEEIKKVTLDYCVSNLRMKNFDEESNKLISLKKSLHDYR